MQSPKNNNNAAQPCGEDPRTPMSARRRATGPRTRQGKERSKKNALKHGFFAKAVLLPGESQADFDALLAGFRDRHQPADAFEDHLVETLVVNRWCRRRVFIAESAEIQLRVKFIEWDTIKRQCEEVYQIEEGHSSGGLFRRIDNPKALNECIFALERLKKT